jgi:hypothetical protein
VIPVVVRTPDVHEDTRPVARVIDRARSAPRSSAVSPGSPDRPDLPLPRRDAAARRRLRLDPAAVDELGRHGRCPPGAVARRRRLLRAGARDRRDQRDEARERQHDPAHLRVNGAAARRDTVARGAACSAGRSFYAMATPGAASVPAARYGRRVSRRASCHARGDGGRRSAVLATLESSRPAPRASRVRLRAASEKFFRLGRRCPPPHLPAWLSVRRWPPPSRRAA